MPFETPPICQVDSRHHVHRLAALPPTHRLIHNAQGPSFRRPLDVEPPPWWCDGCGWPVDDDGH